MKTVRKIRITPKARSLREKELVQHFTTLLRERDKKYQKLQNYNGRLYAQYVGLNEAIKGILKGLPDDPDKPGAYRALDEAFLLPFHPLKNK